MPTTTRRSPSHPGATARAPERRERSRRIPASVWLPLCAASLLLASAAWGHGPTVKLRYGSARPPLLTIQAGQTVHFQNENTSSLPCTVVGDGGAFESPTMEKGGGWHHTFETPGEYGYQLSESARTRGKIIVLEASAP